MSDSGRLRFFEKLVEEAISHSGEQTRLAARAELLDLALHDGAMHEALGWRYSGSQVP